MPGAGAVRRRCSAAVPASRRSPDPLDFRGSFTLKLLREPYWKAEHHECAVSARRILPPHLSRGRISSAAPSCQEHFLSRTLFPRLCCGAVLMGLREACIFATARAATKVAAKPAHVPYGQGQHVSTAGSLARPLDGARSALPILAPACVLRGKRRARTPCPPPCRMTMRRESSLHTR